MNPNKIKIFSGGSNPTLTEKICNHIGLSVGEVYLHNFPSKEKYVQYKENIRGCDVFLVQSENSDANDNLMELLVMIDAAKRASAERITAVIPSCFFYGRQDRKDRSRTPISAKLAANIITEAGANRILGMDFHSQQLTGFFDIPVDQLYSLSVFTDYIRKNMKLDDLVVVSPDEGAVKRSSVLSSILKCGFAFNSKKRSGDTEITSRGLIGDVVDKHVIISDDLTESCGTVIEVAKLCKQNGAKSATALIAHNCITDIGIDRLSNDIYIDKFLVTNSNVSKLQARLDKLPQFETLDISQLFGEAIKRIHVGESISGLFEIDGF